MYRDYENAVVAYYKARKANQTLSHYLSNPTPANFKKECKIVCESRYNKMDDLTLRAFFEKGGDKSAYLQAISLCDIDKFRPVNNFLSGKTNTTAEINIELLAWLIDFQPRPYNDQYDYTDPEFLEVKEDEVELSKDEEVLIGDEPAVEVSGPSKRTFNFNLWKGAAVMAVLVTTTLGLRYYMVRTAKPQGLPLVRQQVPVGPQACMFWNGDHYDPIPCQPGHGDTLVVALDPEKIDHFRMITRPDTITEQSVKKVWYAKYRRRVEFYTGDGFHPIDPQLRLKPATAYMIRKYCQSGALSSASLY